MSIIRTKTKQCIIIFKNRYAYWIFTRRKHENKLHNNTTESKNVIMSTSRKPEQDVFKLPLSL